MLTVQLKDIKAGKLDKDGNVVPYKDVTFEVPQPFALERQKTLTYALDAVDDIEGLEVTTKFIADVRLDVIEITWSDTLDPDFFELDSAFDLLKGELWFAITEKDPGTVDWIGSYNLLDVTLKKDRGRIHVTVQLKTQ